MDNFRYHFNKNNPQKPPQQAKAYPEIKIDKPNPLYGRMMLDNAGGNISEMSATSLYTYDNIILAEDFADAAQAFHKISIAEMHHLKIFSQLALMLGEDPRLWTNSNYRKVYWSPSYNKYSRQILPILKNAADSEANTIRKYEAQADKIDDQNIVCILNRIIEDEKEHLEIFNKLYDKYSASKE